MCSDKDLDQFTASGQLRSRLGQKTLAQLFENSVVIKKIARFEKQDCSPKKL